MNRAKRKIIARFGDVNFPEYNGGVLYKSKYGYSLEYVEYYGDDEDLAAVITVDVPGPDEWRREYWAKDLSGVASYCDTPVEELEEDLSSNDPVKRAGVLYYCLRGYTTIGDEEDMSRKEAMRRYANTRPRRKRSV